ncbi:MAG TPA: hypothetical protein VJZ73_05955 [Methylomirabilota bacterium]|nr:hypothetical protein [Methylomirabilota bacterium]
MKSQGYTYQSTLAASERIHWRVEDLIGGDKRLDFSKPFMPESFARVEPLTFLNPDERLALNHIRALGYLYTFGLVEEFIVPFVLDHARPQLHGDSYAVRALLGFASEEAKHIHLFRRFREEFEKDFGTPCEEIGPPEAVAKAVLAHQPLAVALAILQIEWMTQRHWIEAVRDDQDLDPQFKSLLKHHWMEEAQHSKLDTLVVETLSGSLDGPALDGAVEEYLEIGGMVDGALAQQVEFDIENLARATGRKLNAHERERFVAVQLKGQRWTYLGSGMTHPNFVASLGAMRPEAADRVAKVAPAFC